MGNYTSLETIYQLMATFVLLILCETAQFLRRLGLEILSRMNCPITQSRLLPIKKKL